MSKPAGVLVCIPTRGAISVETTLCLHERMDGTPFKILTAIRKPAAEARNELARAAIAYDSPLFDPKFVFWIDDDAWWREGDVRSAIDLPSANPDVDILCGLFSKRSPNCEAFAVTAEGKRVRPDSTPGGIVPIVDCGFHWVLMRREVLERVGDAPFTYEAMGATSEDVAFCKRAGAVGLRIVAAPSIVTGHVNVNTGMIYFSNSPPLVARGLEQPVYDPELAAMYRDGEVRRYGHPSERELFGNPETAWRHREKGSEYMKFAAEYIKAKTWSDPTASTGLRG